ncbi:hypothetical protein J1614_007408 [Plenodomus biglobosus]|nr:hypothetical protein J1614_007408 [Plenodomus biglobosus]
MIIRRNTLVRITLCQKLQETPRERTRLVSIGVEPQNGASESPRRRTTLSRTKAQFPTKYVVRGTLPNRHLHPPITAATTVRGKSCIVLDEVLLCNKGVLHAMDDPQNSNQ